MLVVIIDIREHDLIALFTADDEVMHATLIARPWSWKTASLDVGDVHFVETDAYADDEEGSGGTVDCDPHRGLFLVLERKTVQDWVASLGDGRYHEQKARLLAAYGLARVAYVLETQTSGTLPTYAATQAKPMNAHTRVTDVSVMSSLVSTQVRDGIRVVHTRDMSDTAAFICLCADRACRRDTSPSAFFFSRDRLSTRDGHDAYAATRALASKKRANVDVRHCYLQQLAQVPGVSITMALALAERYATMCILLTDLMVLPDRRTQVKTLMTVPHIGKISAERLIDYMGARAIAHQGAVSV